MLLESMNMDKWSPFLPVLYAEMHYTLNGFSLIHRHCPEIIADAPHRVEPGETVPILILAKDAHRFPVTLLSADVMVIYPDGQSESISLIAEPQDIDAPWWHTIASIELREGFIGQLRISVRFRFRRKGKSRIHTAWTDTYPQTSHRPLHVTIPGDPLPHLPGWLAGDLHVHSDLTSDQAEFGAPLEAIAALGRAAGLDFAAVTDHSYDLDDREDDYLKTDQDLGKWKRLHASISEIDKKDGFVLLPGEEVSCGNARGRNIHLLLIGQDRFVPGSGDSAERWFRNRPEHSATEILGGLEPGALAFAAHPEDNFTWLHRLLLRRGKWQPQDYLHPNLAGMQILNGVEDAAFQKGLDQWIKLLLAGRRLFIAAGNDAHGNFNRFRQLGLPFLTFREADIHLFGRARTAVFLSEKADRTGILEGLRQGRSVITTGPFLSARIRNETGNIASIGGRITGKQLTLQLEGLSSSEFGPLTSCTVWIGDLTEKRERIVKRICDFSDSFRWKTNIPLDPTDGPSYIRCRLDAETENKRTFCLTNPIWIQHTVDA